jgi:chromosome segregation ATPase
MFPAFPLTTNEGESMSAQAPKKAEDAALQKAREAAEALGAEGEKVTARTVAARAGVRSTAANIAAREWNEAQAAAVPIPPAPESVLFRFEAMWREAITVARSEHDQARAGWEAKVQTAQDEVAELGKDLERIEAEKETAQGQVTALQAEVQRLTQEVAEQRSRADTQTGTAIALADERSRLTARLEEAEADRTQLREKLAALTAAKNNVR